MELVGWNYHEFVFLLIQLDQLVLKQNESDSRACTLRLIAVQRFESQIRQVALSMYRTRI